eukprot:362948-Chlamydomonas_euryale.AAC.3
MPEQSRWPLSGALPGFCCEWQVATIDLWSGRRSKESGTLLSAFHKCICFNLSMMWLNQPRDPRQSIREKPDKTSLRTGASLAASTSARNQTVLMKL